jgi:hypothetical protein
MNYCRSRLDLNQDIGNRITRKNQDYITDTQKQFSDINHFGLISRISDKN